MKTEVANVCKEEGYRDAIQRASRLLEEGGLVAFPTETVYGLGANAANPDAIERLRGVKQRAETKPFTLHIPDRSKLTDYVPDPGRMGRRLAEKAWPGPLTVVFRVADVAAAPVVSRLPDGRTDLLYHEGTIGIRCPDNRPAEDMLAAASVPVVAASANGAGRPAPVTADEVIRELDGQVDLILDGGVARYSRASTIVRVDGDSVEVLRQGVYDERMVRRFLSVNILFVCTGNTCRSPMAEVICRRLLAEKLGVPADDLEKQGYGVQSAGVMGFGGARASQGAVNAMRGRGIDLSGHRSQAVTPELIYSSDRVYAMSREHLEAVVRIAPSAAGKAYLLDADRDIDDPVGADDGVYQECAGRIEAALRRRLEEIPL